MSADFYNDTSPMKSESCPKRSQAGEKEKAVPQIAFMPAIVRFLGYDPTPEPTTLADRMRSYRQRLGLSIKEAAHRARVDESSWGTWERTGLIPWKRYRTLVDEFLALQLGI